MGSCIRCPMETRFKTISQIEFIRNNNENNIFTNVKEIDKIDNASNNCKSLKNLYIYRKIISNNKSHINPNNGQILLNNDKEIDIFFLFNEKKDLYLTVNSSQIFKEVEKLLREKYNWINSFTDISFYYNNLIIKDKTKTMNELGINNDDTILIKAK